MAFVFSSPTAPESVPQASAIDDPLSNAEAVLQNSGAGSALAKNAENPSGLHPIAQASASVKGERADLPGDDTKRPTQDVKAFALLRKALSEDLAT